jgi:acetyl esterase/lipase
MTILSIKTFRLLPLLMLAALTATPVGAQEPVPLDLFAEVQVDKDVAYLGEGRAEKMDLYRPVGAAPERRFPAVLIIHGGGWTGGSKSANRERQMGEVFAKAGFVAASIDYLLATPDKPSWPVNLHDCKTAVRFLRANAAKYQIDPERIATIGGSAGGHLAMMVAFTGGKLDPAGPYAEHSTAVKAVVNLYGVPDLTVRAARFLGDGENDPEVRKLASPVTYVSKTSVPVLTLHGTADATVPISMSEDLVKVLQERGATHQYVRVEGAPHTFLINSKHGDFRSLIVGFFRQHLGVSL